MTILIPITLEAEEWAIILATLKKTMRDFHRLPGTIGMRDKIGEIILELQVQLNITPEGDLK